MTEKLSHRVGLLLLAPFLFFVSETASQGFGPTPEEETKLVSSLGLSPGKVVGEIGAGDGQLAIRSARAVSPGGRVYASELGESRRATLKRNLDNAGVTNVEVVEARISATGLPAGGCDAVFMRDVYHHLTEPEAILADILKVLRPEGLLLIIDFEPRSSLPRIEGVPDNRRGHGVPMGVVTDELKAAGFEIVRQDGAWRDDLYAVLARRPVTAPSR